MTNAFVTQPAGLIHDDNPDTMALRDYFAAKAMQTYLSQSGCATQANVATTSYAMADAMLKAREGGAA
jgi:hypothetical protein